jgi:predicted secreted Zn-dependent protease
VSSIRANGPVVKWLNGRAEAVTQADPHYGFELNEVGGQCRIVPKTKPTVYFSFTITLPKWVPPADAGRSTVTWWNDRLKDTAVHERHHVELTRAAGAQMSNAVATSTCESLAGNLTKIANDLNRQNCEFDMREYGAAMGLTLSACLAP